MLSLNFRQICLPLSGWLLLIQPAVLLAAPANTPHAKVALVAEQTSVQPGHEFRLGLHFQLEKHWHIYWINPGDSGEPPRVEWMFPAQFQAGPIKWPVPQRLENGPLVDYGYENEVLLTTTVRAPTNLRVGDPVEIKADVKWLVCHDICIPERQTVAISLPIASHAPKKDSRWRELFAHARSRLPRRLPAAWNVTAASNTKFFILLIRTGSREPSASFFPLEPLQLRNAAPQQAAPLDQGVRLSLPKSDQLVHPVSMLKGVLVLSQGRAYAVAVSVTSRNHTD